MSADPTEWAASAGGGISDTPRVVNAVDLPADTPSLAAGPRSDCSTLSAIRRAWRRLQALRRLLRMQANRMHVDGARYDIFRPPGDDIQ
jgi:hypothetical protein